MLKRFLISKRLCRRFQRGFPPLCKPRRLLRQPALEIRLP